MYDVWHCGCSSCCCSLYCFTLKNVVLCVLNICSLWEECLTVYDVWRCGYISYCFCLSYCFVLIKYCLMSAKYLHSMRMFKSVRCLTLCLFFYIVVLHIMLYWRQFIVCVLYIWIVWEECLTVYDVWHCVFFILLSFISFYIEDNLSYVC